MLHKSDSTGIGWLFAYAVIVAVMLFSSTAAQLFAEVQTDRLVIETSTGSHKFSVEIADTPDTRERGLMFRRELAADRGMLFDWHKIAPVAMWMKNTYISLDMVFIEADGTVARVAESTTPHSLRHIPSGKPVAAVLEVIAGTAKRIDLKSGDKVRHKIFTAQ